MAVIPVQKNETKSPSVSYIKSAVIGGLTGYTLKYVLPITKEEKDDFYKSFLEKMHKEVTEAKAKEIEAIRNTKSRTLAEDAFISIVDKHGVKTSEIKRLKEPLAFDVMKIVSKINEKGKEVKTYEKEVFKAITKRIRPTRTFVGIGVTAALATAFARNVVKKLSETKS